MMSVACRSAVCTWVCTATWQRRPPATCTALTLEHHKTRHQWTHKWWPHYSSLHVCLCSFFYPFIPVCGNSYMHTISTGVCPNNRESHLFNQLAFFGVENFTWSKVNIYLFIFNKVKWCDTNNYNIDMAIGLSPVCLQIPIEHQDFLGCVWHSRQERSQS